MAQQAEHTLSQALAAFDFGGPAQGTLRFGEGHINDTFLVDAGTGRFILQRLSTAAFKEPDKLTRNVVNITDYLAREIARQGGDPSRETLRVVRTRRGEDSFTDSDGGVWRVFPFVEGKIGRASCRERV